jgi:hypothetical protein
MPSCRHKFLLRQLQIKRLYSCLLSFVSVCLVCLVHIHRVALCEFANAL